MIQEKTDQKHGWVRSSLERFTEDISLYESRKAIQPTPSKMKAQVRQGRPSSPWDGYPMGVHSSAVQCCREVESMTLVLHTHQLIAGDPP